MCVCVWLCVGVCRYVCVCLVVCKCVCVCLVVCKCVCLWISWCIFVCVCHDRDRTVLWRWIKDRPTGVFSVAADVTCDV